MEKRSEEFNGDIPVLNVKGESLPEAWENSVVELYNHGGMYKRQGPKDKGKLQLDSTMTMVIENPDSKLFMHKYIGCGIEDLLGYEMELLGAKDSWVVDDYDSVSDKRWAYHYHQRLASYPDGRETIDQIESMIKGLSNEPYTRRNTAITWVPKLDIGHKDPPCMQSVWAYIAPCKDNTFKLNMNFRFRSRNVMIAAPMNLAGEYALQCYIREKVIENTGMILKNGRLLDFSDSYHVSARDQPILKGFIERLEKSKEKNETIVERAYNRKFVFGYMEEERLKVEKKIIDQTQKRFVERGERQVGKIKEISKYLGGYHAREN